MAGMFCQQNAINPVDARAPFGKIEQYWQIEMLSVAEAASQLYAETDVWPIKLQGFRFATPDFNRDWTPPLKL